MTSVCVIPVHIDPNRFCPLTCDMFDLYNIPGNTVQATRQNVSTRTIFSAISVSPKTENKKKG
jgi:hypothetical protein